MLIGLIFRASHFGALPNLKDSRIQNSPAFNCKQFVNNDNVDMSMNFSKFKKLLPQILKQKKNRRPEKNSIISDKSAIRFAGSCGNGIQITWFGHSSIMLDVNGKRILFDPMLSKYASPFPGFVKRFKNSILFNESDYERLGKIDAIIISHDHYDHLDYTTISSLMDNTDKFYVPLGVGSHLRKWEVEDSKITEADWWEEFNFDNINLVCTPAQHFSGRRAGKRNNTLWTSWLIQVNGKNIYFSGDTGYFDGFKQIKEQYGSIDFAMLECGQYNELWEEIHMLPEQTFQAAIDLEAKQIMPIHNMAFSLALHSYYEPKKIAKSTAEKQYIDIVDILPGKSFFCR